MVVVLVGGGDGFVVDCCGVQLQRAPYYKHLGLANQAGWWQYNCFKEELEKALVYLTKPSTDISQKQCVDCLSNND